MSALLDTWMACVYPDAAARCAPTTADLAALLALALGATLLLVATRRVATALRTLRALSLTPVLSRRLAHWVRPRSYSDEQFFQADGAGAVTVASRRRGIERLAATLHEQYPASRAWGTGIREGFSDLRFTDANRVPFPFARVMRERFDLCSVVTASDGPYLQTATRTGWPGASSGCATSDRSWARSTRSPRRTSRCSGASRAWMRCRST